MLAREVLEELVRVLGRENVLTEQEDLLTYAYDATAAMKHHKPDVVVAPLSTEQVADVVKIALRYHVPIYTRGSGTNLSGGTIPVEGGMVLSMLHLNKILEVDQDNLTATVQPGVIIQALNDEAAKHGLLYPPDPGTVTTATMGGSVSECSGGLRGLKYGVTKHYIMGLQMVLANGEVTRWGGKTVKNVTGYDLVALFTGAEGTLGIITEIIVKLIPAPEARKSMLAVFDDVDKAGRAIAAIIRNKVIPATLEILDNVTIQTVENFVHAGLPMDAEAVLLCEVDGYKEVVQREAVLVERIMNEEGAVQLKIAKDDKERDLLWLARRSALPALAQKRPTTVLEDATVPRSKIPDMLKAIRRIATKHNLQIATFGHAGDGNLHPTIITDERDAEEMKRVHLAVDEIFETALALGGTLSGEHGIGIAKMKYLNREFGEAGVAALKRIKEALDPNYLLNPGKIVRRD
ncbi:FAD-binding oxidoreductase [Desulfosporosinus meridiei]|uniref:FAD/FMN-dependent dehydrogenase n=1 Tax=Desulfosporosinus meridiei (strain ATCC BAA-275 / DSM 13257 / KCTC 12902 / NCIMB 13706 / S10) TaxID=768704 RepID=J7IUC3_DESMD|nr:FAD-linked oxidase C-terminal domain-containing protein [Desulfosporosinus meridiei]AFQ43769.1 FAD/FMN-dependent dehydrogenase [Desulfosporosinus meridiei DSM 13257]